MQFFEETISKKTIFNGKVFDVNLLDVALADNSTAYREIVTHNGGAGILAIDDDKFCYLVKQFRKGAEQEMLEIPAGKLEKSEKPIDCAKRELEEEVGFVSENIKDLGYFFPTPAYCTEKIHIYLATNLKKTAQKLDDGEFLEIVKLPFDIVYEMVLKGEIVDAKTIIAVMKAKELI